ncbi:MAG TPA: exodeoxyribonuclease VII large subunit, partial [Candidatus Fraserbacteria bacterium]|nr:exodeoxyribonuclease VII large subunit [Candidatus Fraserbacteria bacterium]
GGSLEDLWAFNEERVARAIYASEIPVISAVGHEMDVTIADLVADLRAPTPSAAAELAVPRRDELLGQAHQSLHRLIRSQRRQLESKRAQLEMLVQNYALRRPLRRLGDFQQRLDGLSARLPRGFREGWRRRLERLAGLQARLAAANPAGLLRRGYCLVEKASGRLVRSAEQVKPGELVRIQLHSGALTCEVREVNLKGDQRDRT